jgi:CubicO group peptidase (beta-lactamase class C family)
MFHRRDVLRSFLGLLAGCNLGGKALLAQQAQPGQAKDFAIVDRVVARLMEENQLAGASMAIAQHGELVLSKGYGLANVEKSEPVKPETLFSSGSVDKPLTGMACLKLIDDGKLNLDARLVDILSDLHPLPGKKIAPRFRDVTVHHLLYHAAGLVNITPEQGKELVADDMDAGIPKNYEPMLNATDKYNHVIARYRALMSEPTKFAPGTRTEYSNIGFMVLGIVVGRVSGLGHESYVREHVLKPMKITQTHQEAPGDYEPGETRRYQKGGSKPTARRHVSNWLTTAPELVRFVSAVAGSNGKPFLSKKLTARMLAVPPGVMKRANEPHLGLGWEGVQQFPQGYRFQKNGGKLGVRAWVQHMESGIDWAFLCNTETAENFLSTMSQRMHRAF